MPLMTFVSAIVVILILNIIFYHTRLGRAFRATSDDPQCAQLMGIENRKVFALAMGLAMVVSLVAAVYLGIRANFDPSIGPSRLSMPLKPSSSVGSEASGARSPAA